MTEQREELKANLLRQVAKFNLAELAGPHPPEIDALIEKIVPLSPYPHPASTLSAITGSWRGLYARYGTGTSKGRSERDRSNLSLHSFKVFPPVPIDVTETLQEIGKTPPAYNNVVFFRAVETGARGCIINHGTWHADPANPKRFNVVFYSAELRPMPGAAEQDLKTGLGLPSDATLRRDYKPAKLWSDVVYLDDDTRVNIAGMGGIYVLERRTEAPVTLIETLTDA